MWEWHTCKGFFRGLNQLLQNVLFMSQLTDMSGVAWGLSATLPDKALAALVLPGRSDLLELSVSALPSPDCAMAGPGKG